MSDNKLAIALNMLVAILIGCAPVEPLFPENTANEPEPTSVPPPLLRYTTIKPGEIVAWPPIPILKPPANAELTNIVQCGGAEEPDSSIHWQIPPSAGSLEVTSIVSAQGERAYQVLSNSNFSVLQSVPVKPLSLYWFAAYTYLPNSGRMTLMASTPGGTSAKSQDVASGPMTSWARTTMSFVPGPGVDNIDVALYFEELQGTVGLFDIVTLYEINAPNIVENGDFETERIAGWYREGVDLADRIPIRSQEAYAGNYSLELKGRPDGSFATSRVVSGASRFEGKTLWISAMVRSGTNTEVDRPGLRLRVRSLTAEGLLNGEYIFFDIPISVNSAWGNVNQIVEIPRDLANSEYSLTLMFERLDDSASPIYVDNVVMLDISHHEFVGMLTTRKNATQ